MACDDFFNNLSNNVGPNNHIQTNKKANENPDSCPILPHCRKVVPNQPKQRHTCRHITKCKAVITCLVSHCLLPNTPQLCTAQKSAIKIAAENSSLFMMSGCVTMLLINVWQSECGSYQTYTSVTLFASSMQLKRCYRCVWEWTDGNVKPDNDDTWFVDTACVVNRWKCTFMWDDL